MPESGARRPRHALSLAVDLPNSKMTIWVDGTLDRREKGEGVCCNSFFWFEVVCRSFAWCFRCCFVRCFWAVVPWDEDHSSALSA